MNFQLWMNVATPTTTLAPIIGVVKQMNGEREEWFVRLGGASVGEVIHAFYEHGELHLERIEGDLPRRTEPVNMWHELPHRLGVSFLLWISPEERECIRRTHQRYKEMVPGGVPPDHFNDILVSLENVERDLAAGVFDVA